MIETTETIKKEMRCKGTVRGTNQKCTEILCETDGKKMFVRNGDKILTIIPKKGSSVMALTCPNCGYNNSWGKH
ncbi:MAG: hypothetical protein LUM44_17720 [Pyrinomonadaceae bacterium]|nr:hypothetical protein [Pyrinomonadaceae bacterium]